MRTVLIHGQNHATGSSCTIGRMLADRVSTKDERTEFFLPRDLDHFCTGCCRCLEDDALCPFRKEKKVIMDKILSADLLIFTTPTYCMHVSAGMKAFMELTFTNWMVHRPKREMFSKKAVIISTAAGVGTASAMKDISTMLLHWGVPKVWKYGVSVQAMGWENVASLKKQKIEADMEGLSGKIRNSGKPGVPVRTRFLFSVMRMMQKKGMGSTPEEKVWWEENGWLGRARPWK